MKRKSDRWLVILALSAAFISPPHRTSAVDASLQPLPGQKILVTGHSFHIPVMPQFELIVKAAGIPGHQIVARQSIGGSRVMQHWDRPDDTNVAKATLKAGGVDVMTMAPNAMVPDEAIGKFVELGLEKNPNLRALVQVSWFPWDGLKPPARVATNADRDSKTAADLRAVYDPFRDILRTQVREINSQQKRTVAFIVPVGEAVLRLREQVIAGKVPSIAKQSDLFTDQIGHAKAAVLHLAACCQYACIYRRSPVGLTYTIPGLDPALVPLLQKIAWDAVTDEPLSGVSAAP